MVNAKLLSFVKSVRLRYALPFVFLLVVVHTTRIHPWMTNWGSTTSERLLTLPGDELHLNRAGQSTWAITIDAPSDVVWQWLVQIGQDRAGFYSYIWLENLIGADIHNADEIHPEWQNLAVGDGWRLVPPDYLWGMGKEMVSPVLIIEPGRALVLEMFGAHVIDPIDDYTSRLNVRSESGPASLLKTMIADPVVFTMERRMLLGLKARAEGHSDAPAVLMAIAKFGWVAAGITLAFLFLKQRRKQYWLSLPILATLPGLLTSSDLQAALAAFLAVGITTFGFLVFGRNWWGSLLIIASVVMLTPLIAPEAYTTFGLAFILLLTTALGSMVASRCKTVGRVPDQLATPTS